MIGVRLDHLKRHSETSMKAIQVGRECTSLSHRLLWVGRPRGHLKAHPRDEKKIRKKMRKNTHEEIERFVEEMREEKIQRKRRRG